MSVKALVNFRNIIQEGKKRQHDLLLGLHYLLNTFMRQTGALRLYISSECNISLSLASLFVMYAN